MQRRTSAEDVVATPEARPDRVAVGRSTDGASDVGSAAERLVDRLAFDDAGLVPAVVQDHDSGDVLMVAWMNAEAVTATLHEGRTVFWSRSRERLWRKGETSGHVQHVRDLHVDCDADTLLVSVDQDGAACHTGERTCFFRRPADLVDVTDRPAPVDPTGGSVPAPDAAADLLSDRAPS